MAIQRGESSFTTAGGQVYKLVMDFAAFADAEDAADMSVQDLLAAIDPKIDPETKEPTRTPRIAHLGALFYGALQAVHPGTSVRDAIRIMGDNEGAGEALAKALHGALPKADQSAEGKVEAPASGTGTKPKKTGRQKV